MLGGITLSLVLLGIVILYYMVWIYQLGVFTAFKADKSEFCHKSSFHGTDGPRGYGVATHYGL